MFWLLANIWAALDGLCDALLYGRLGADSFTWNEHAPLVSRRAFVLLAALGAGADAVLVGEGYVGRLPLWLLWLACEATAVTLSFSLFHNEVFNFGRVWLKEQDFRKAWAVFEFNYQSPSTTARFDFDGVQRWVLAGAAVLVLASGYVLLVKF